MKKIFIDILLILLSLFLILIIFKSHLFIYPIKFIDNNILGIVGLLFIFYTINGYLCNKITKNKYKREKNNNDSRYISMRCFEDGDEEEKDLPKNSRDYIYLVELVELVENEEKKFHRIVNLYTLDQLGYPRPSRKNDKCFKKSDGYSLGEEIRVRNIISDIKDILNLKEKMK